MSETLAPGTMVTPGDGPITGDTPTKEFSPAELGIDTEPHVNDNVTPNVHDKGEQLEQPAQEDDTDLVGQILKRGRPARELDDLDEEEQDIFKNMSRKAYEKLYPFYKQFRGKEKDLASLTDLQKQLEEAKAAQTRPTSYYDHEQAYMFSPQFAELARAQNEQELIAQHWQQQLANLDEEKPIHDLIRDANGQLRLSEPIQPTPAARGQLTALLTRSLQEQANYTAQINALKESHGTQYKSYKDGLGKAFDAFFGKHKDTLGPLAKEELKLFPEFVHGRPEIQLLTHAIAMLRQIAKQDKAAQAQQAATTVNAKGQKTAGPTMRSLTTAPKDANNATSDEDYKLFKQMFM